MRARARFLLLLPLAAAACRRAPADAAPAGGTLTVSWTTTDTTLGPGRWVGPAQAGWCDSTRRLVVLAARGDTGMALRVQSPLGDAGEFVVLPEADSAQPKYAVAALRWFGGSRVTATKARTGTLTLDRLQGTAAGTLRAIFPVAADEDSLVAEATLAAVPVRTGTDGCRIAGSGVP